jgi:hypothetical protein
MLIITTSLSSLRLAAYEVPAATLTYYLANQENDYFNKATILANHKLLFPEGCERTHAFYGMSEEFAAAVIAHAKRKPAMAV